MLVEAATSEETFAVDPGVGRVRAEAEVAMHNETESATVEKVNPPTRVNFRFIWFGASCSPQQIFSSLTCSYATFSSRNAKMMFASITVSLRKSRI